MKAHNERFNEDLEKAERTMSKIWLLVVALPCVLLLVVFFVGKLLHK